MACRLAGLSTVGLLSASLGCHSPAETSAKETASLAVRLISPPVAQSFLFPPSAPQELWTVAFEVEVKETKCVAASLTFVEVQVFDESVQMNFGAFPHRWDQGDLVRQGLGQLAACGAGVVFRGTIGNIAGLGDSLPKGPVRVMVRAIGVDEHGHGIGIDTNVESPLVVVRRLSTRDDVEGSGRSSFASTLLTGISLSRRAGAYASVKDRIEALEAGYLEHVAKPVPPYQVARVIASAVRRPS
jgi:hypothetical protein